MKFTHDGIFAFTLSFLIFILPISTYSKQIHYLFMLNHFNKPIHWMITINPQVLPGFANEFNLGINEQIQTEVLDLQKEAYLSGRDDQQHNAFWGVKVVDQHLKFYGYLGKGIAYSWNNNTIIFCTPAEYKNKRHC